MASINPHINFNGNAQEAFDFYRGVFGGEFTKVIHFKDMASEHFPVPPEEADKLMSIALPIGATMLMGNDVPSFMGRTNENENRSKIYIIADSHEEANKLFTGLSAGGQVEMPIEENSDTCFAMFRDKYGIEWEVEYSAKI